MAKSIDDPSFPVRNLRFVLEGDVPRYWLGGERALSLLLDHLSILFPPGEAFFMASVRALEQRVADPQLRADVRAFHGQEALHGREHRRYNDRLRGLGYPVDAIDRSARRLLWLAEKVLGKRAQLAVTAALEHFTALFAQVVLRDDSFMNAAHPEMRALWRWHAAEENEHSHVAFDVLRAAGGGYLLRTSVMLLVSVLFLEKIAEHQLRMMWHDGCLFSLREWRSLGRFLFVEPAMVAKVWPLYWQYFRLSFHPHQIESRALMQRWLSDFASDDRYQSRLTAGKGPAAA
jgi:uncharacterized protein